MFIGIFFYYAAFKIHRSRGNYVVVVVVVVIALLLCLFSYVFSQAPAS